MTHCAACPNRTIIATLLFLPQIAGWAGRCSADGAAPSEASDVAASDVELEWQTDYFTAYRQARDEQRMLLINFTPVNRNSSYELAQSELEEAIRTDATVRGKLSRFVRLRLPVSASLEIEGQSAVLIEHEAFAQMGRAPGIAILDLTRSATSYYGRVVSAFPFSPGKYYRWRSDYLPVILDLPSGTITQRTMVWAVRVHPEHPASTTGQQDVRLAGAAASHSQHQAAIGVQGHHQWETRFHQIRGAVHSSAATEVVAESWPDQNLLDSCLDCVASWRHSPGHWGAVRRRHRLFGYDIRRGRNGIWYGTGIFAD